MPLSHVPAGCGLPRQTAMFGIADAWTKSLVTVVTPELCRTGFGAAPRGQVPSRQCDRDNCG